MALVACGGDPFATSVTHQADADESPSVEASAGDTRATDAAANDAAACSVPILSASEGNIAALLDAVDAAEVSLDQAVRARLKDTAVVAFAEKAITDHTLLDLELRGAVRADRLAILASDTSAAVVSQEVQAAQAFGPLDGMVLDRAYIAHELLVHLQEIAILDHIALPGVKDVRLAAAVAAARELAAEHVQLAASVQAKLDAPP
jgi:predicted outer membrane protein